jgi:hypothetical protein
MLFGTKMFHTLTYPKPFERLNANLKVKITKKKRVGVHSLIHNISRVRRASWTSKMGTRMNEKWVNYSYGPTQTKN